MTDIDGKTQAPVVSPDLITLTHIIYALHAFSVLTGMFSAAFIVTAFLSGWPSIIAVIINYVKRNEVRGSFLDSHFSWQIRTFWWSLLWLVIGGVLTLVLVGWAILGLTGLWILYRIIRGWLALLGRNAMPMSD